MHFVYRLQSLYRGVFTKEALRDTQENPGFMQFSLQSAQEMADLLRRFILSSNLSITIQ